MCIDIILLGRYLYILYCSRRETWFPEIRKPRLIVHRLPHPHTILTHTHTHTNTHTHVLTQHAYDPPLVTSCHRGRPFVCRFPAAAGRSVGHTCDGLYIYRYILLCLYFIYVHNRPAIPSEDPAVIISVSSPVRFGCVFVYCSNIARVCTRQYVHHISLKFRIAILLFKNIIL